MSTTKETTYFPHDSNAKDDPKIMLMMAQLGLEAYGIYWILVEYLREQPGYQAPFILLDPLSRRYGSSKEKFEAVVTRFGLFEYDENIFASHSLKKRMEPLELKREKMQQLALMRWNRDNNTDVMRTHSAGNTQAMQSRVEKSREEKSKVKKSKEEKSIEEFIASLPSSFLPVWKIWIDYKRSIKKPYKTIAGMRGKFEELVEMSGNNPEVAMRIVQKSVKEEWSGFFPLKADFKASKEEDPIDRERRLLKEYRASQKQEKTA